MPKIPFGNSKKSAWRKPQATKYDLQKKQSNFAHIYSKKEWKNARRQCLKREPLCEHCSLNGKVTAATSVDHIHPLRFFTQEDWNKGLAYAQENLQSLCHSCHAIEEAKKVNYRETAKDSLAAKRTEENIVREQVWKNNNFSKDNFSTYVVDPNTGEEYETRIF